MKIKIESSVILINRDGFKDVVLGFESPQSAIKYFDKKIKLNEFIEGTIKVNIKKG